MLRRTLLPLLAARAAALVVPMKAANPTKSLTGQRLERANGAGSIDVGAILQTTQSKTLVVLGTHAADFNACEYMQKVRFYLPRLAEAGVDRYLFVVNGDARQASKLAELLDLPDEVELLADSAAVKAGVAVPTVELAGDLDAAATAPPHHVG